jgi:16S rRNA (guanine527-N7)-methyltransferase
MTESPNPAATRLNAILAEASQAPLDTAQTQRFEALLSLFLRWSARINLTSIRGEEGILSRHFVESIACARALPAGISTLLDFGSGAGFPGLPIALCRPEIAVTLAESQGKKAAFLREAVRVLRVAAKVHSGRAESLATNFDCVTMRAVDKMERAVQSAAKLVRPGGWLALMTTTASLPALKAAVERSAEIIDPEGSAATEGGGGLPGSPASDLGAQGWNFNPRTLSAKMSRALAPEEGSAASTAEFSWSAAPLLPSSDDRLLALGLRANQPPSQ